MNVVANGISMSSKKKHSIICLNKNDMTFLKEADIEEILDVEDRKNVPIRTGNVRKSIEHYLERRKLKELIIDFYFKDNE
jgi:hypothetical protein